jgi:hypothetical protein
MNYTSATAVWDALEKKYAEAEASRWLYVCEKFFDFSMDNAKSIVTQAHDPQLLVGDIAHLGCALPPKFVAVAIVAKLPAEWRCYVYKAQKRGDFYGGSHCSSRCRKEGKSKRCADQERAEQCQFCSKEQTI